jgi:hypothetical protein
MALLLVPVGTVTGAAVQQGVGVEQHTSYVEIRTQADPGPDDVEVAFADVECAPGSSVASAVTWAKTGGERTCAPAGLEVAFAHAASAPDPRGNPTLTPTDRAFVVETDTGTFEVREHAYRTAQGQTHYTWVTPLSSGQHTADEPVPIVANTSRLADAGADVTVSTGAAPGPAAGDPTLVRHLDLTTDKGLSA